MARPPSSSTSALPATGVQPAASTKVFFRSETLQPRVAGQQTLLTDVDEPHRQLDVVPEVLDAQHRADTKLRVTDPRAGADAGPGLVLARVVVGRPPTVVHAPGLAFPARSRVEVRLRAARVGGAEEARRTGLGVVDERGRDLIDETGGLAGLVLAEHTPAQRARQHQPGFRPRHAHVAQPP